MERYLIRHLSLLPILVSVVEGTKLCRYYYYVDGRRVMGSYFCLHEQTCCNNRQCCETGGTVSFSVRELWYFWLCIAAVVIIIAAGLIRFINQKYRMRVYPHHSHHAARSHGPVVTRSISNAIAAAAYYPEHPDGQRSPYPEASVQYVPPTRYEDTMHPYSTWPICQQPGVVMAPPGYPPRAQTNCGVPAPSMSTEGQRYTTVCTTHM